MAYNDVPQAGQRIKDTQSLIRSNFSNIQTAFSVNHIPIQDPSGNEGKHKFVTMPEQTSAPTTLANEAALYSRNSTLSSQTELVWRRESNGSVIEFTSLGAVAGTKTIPGWAILPSGILIKWGRGAFNDGFGTMVVTLNAAGQPTYASVFQGFITSFVSNQTVAFISFTGTATATFASTDASGTTQGNFLVIGLAS